MARSVRSSAADIALTLGINPVYDSRRIADEMTRGFSQAGNKAGIDYNKSLTAQIDKMTPAISRAMRKTSAALLQVDEASAKVASRFNEAEKAQQNLTRRTEEYNRVLGDSTASEEDRARALALVSEAERDVSATTRALVSERARLNRANQSTASSLSLVNKALQDIGKETSSQQTLLTIGKNISALRAVGVPIAAITAFEALGAVVTSAAYATQALWLIPAAATAAGSAMGSLSIATMGFTDAVEAMGDSEKFATAIRALSPEAQQAALSLRALLGPLESLKNATQDALFADSGPMINQLANQYLPIIEQLTTGIAGAFNNMGKQIFGVLMTPEMQQSIASIVNNISEAFNNLAPAMAPLTSAFVKITEAGASLLPMFAKAATDAATKFGNFINEAAKSGKLQEWLDKGVNALKLMIKGVSEAAQAFMRLAPTGERMLPDIVKSLEAIKIIAPAIGRAIEFLAGPFEDIGKIVFDIKKLIDDSRGAMVWFGKAVEQQFRLLAPIIDAAFAPLRAAIALINRTPILGRMLNLPNIPSARGIGAIFGSVGSLYPGGQAVGRNQMGGLGRSAGQRIGGSAQMPRSTLDRIHGTDNSMWNPWGTANLPAYPDGGYPLPPQRAKDRPTSPVGITDANDMSTGNGKKGKKDEPPFTADPSTYSLDSIPIGSFFDSAGNVAVPSASAAGAPLAAEAPPMPVMDAAPGIDFSMVPRPLGVNPSIGAINLIAQQAGLQLTSGASASGTHVFDGGHHDYGEAGDFSNSSGPTPEMHAFATYMAQNFGGLIEELIYSDPIRGDVLIGGGQFVGPGTDQPNYYDATTRAQHMNHVHIAVKEAMAPYLEAAMQGNMFGAYGAGGMGNLGYSGYIAIDQEKIAKAEADRDQAARTVEEKRMAYLKLKQSGDADELQMLRARNDVIDAEQTLVERERAVSEARMGTYKEFDGKLKDSAKQVSASMGQIGTDLAGDFGISEGLPGIAKWLTQFLGNLAFAPMLGALSAVSQAGNTASNTRGASGLIGMFAPPADNMLGGLLGNGQQGGLANLFAPGAAAQPGAAAMGPTPLGGAVGLPLMKYDDGGMMPSGGMGINLTGKPEPVLTPDQWSMVQAAMAPPPQPTHQGTGAPPGPTTTDGATAQTSRSAAAAFGGGGFSGLGGLPLQGINSAISAAGLALDGLAPGAGQVASAAAQIGVQLANRAVGYAGQLAGIGVGGLMDTFLPNNSPLADPNNSWFGRIASGFAGARPALPNTAGNPAPAQPQSASAGAQQQPGGPMVSVGAINNYTNDGGQSVARQIGRMQMSSYASGGPR